MSQVVDNKMAEISFIDFSDGIHIHTNDNFNVIPLDKGSFSNFYKLYASSELMAFIRKPMDFYQANKSFDRILKLMAKAKPTRYYCEIKTDAGKSVGIIGIVSHGHNQEYEVGVIIDQAFQKKRLSLKAKLAVMDWLFQQSTMIKVTAYCRPDNTAPNHINKLLKFSFEGVGAYHGYKEPMNKWVMTHENYACLYT